MEILIIKFKILTDFTVLNINTSFKVFFLIYRLFAVVVKYYSVKQFVLSTTTMLSTCINRLVKLVNNNITPLYHPPKLATDGTGCSVFAVRFFFFFFAFSVSVSRIIPIYMSTGLVLRRILLYYKELRWK